MRNGFEKGNTIGRPRNAKNKLARKVIEDLARIWDEPILPNSTITRGEAAMRVMSKEHPDQFVKAYVSLVPREMILSDPSTADLTDGRLTSSCLISARAGLPPPRSLSWRRPMRR